VNVWQRIFYIPGNHEYYSIDPDDIVPFYEIDEKLFQLEKITRVELLIRKKIELPEITLLGTTLWSSLDLTKIDAIQVCLNDFNKIYLTGCDLFGKKNIEPIQYLEWYHRDVKWLQSQLESLNKDDHITSKPVWVLTHHLPSFKCIDPKYKNSSHINSCFASNLDYLVEKTDVWLFGHSHTNISIEIENTIVMSNPLGYPFERSECGFDPARFVPLPKMT